MSTTFCWICKSKKTVLFKKSNLSKDLSSSDFAITDYNYGITTNLRKCLNCGFIFSEDNHHLLSFYENLVDEEYENTGDERAYQFRYFLKQISKNVKSSGNNLTLLDVGAGSGIFVNEAIKFNFNAKGIEPSKWLVKRAQNRSIPVLQGTLDQISENFDIVTLFDVIEHVNDPIKLLIDIRERINPGGTLILTTPDVKSLVARLLGSRWWHFRIAHVGYFSTKTIRRACETAGYKVTEIKRVGWCFNFGYLYERLGVYIPLLRNVSIPEKISKLSVRINLFDSLIIFCRKNAG